MKNDRSITITVGESRRSLTWSPETLTLADFYKRLSTPHRSPETMEEYLALDKVTQDDKKDVGGFVAGRLSGERRKAGAVIGRDVVTLDCDNIPPGGADGIIKRLESMGCGYCVYSTRKHSPESPRLRILFPLDREATADEYEPTARYLAESIGMAFVDPTTFETSRMMYWPSCCKDSEYIFECADKPFVAVDGVLTGLTKANGDWRDASRWSKAPGEPTRIGKRGEKQEPPKTKGGIVGAFCSVYNVLAAMETFLPEAYSPVEGTTDRYTLVGASTTGGAVVYDNGDFLFSHHSTDPCTGVLVNAFDLVRLHRFGAMDQDAVEDTPTNTLPSYRAMSELAWADPKVAKMLIKTRIATAAQDFEAVVQDAENTDTDTDWLALLDLNAKTGAIRPTIDNVWIILENEKDLKGKFALNEFMGRAEVLGALPWNGGTTRRGWTDTDTQGMCWYLEKKYKIASVSKVESALALQWERHRFDEVKEYLSGPVWDGVHRLDTLLIDYLGAEDTPYTRAVTRKIFTAAVARVVNPGCKFDNMLILSGRQGVGKSTLFSKLSRGWFNDSIRTFEGKEASELLQGAWLVEISELDAFRLTDVARIKQFLSLQHDRFRAAYGKHVKEVPRRCVFVGTTNSATYLRDRTGNRRFWPVDVGVAPQTKDIWGQLDSEIDQIWAEAVARFKDGEVLYLTGEIEVLAINEQEAHRDAGIKEGVILDFIAEKVPVDWMRWDLDKRRMYLSGGMTYSGEAVPRHRVCALEIWCEAFGGSPKDLKYNDATEINDVLRRAEGWEFSAKAQRFGYCGVQKGAKRILQA